MPFRGIVAPSVQLRTTSFWLKVLVLACILPSLIIGIFFVSESYVRERSRIQKDTIGTSRALVQAVDREISVSIAGLRALASSPYLATNDFASFQRQAEIALRSIPAENVVLLDRTGHQIINTLRPYGTALPRQTTPAVLAGFETRQPIITHLFDGAVTRKPRIAVGIPVTEDGAVIYELTVGIFPERLAHILRRQRDRDDLVIAIFDNTGTILARTPALEQSVGKKASPELVRAIARSNEGLIEASTLEGIPVLAGFSRSEISGWSVAIGVPLHELSALRRNLLFTIAGALVLIALSILLANLIAGRIVKSIRSLLEPALALASGRQVSPPRTMIAETQQVVLAMADASQLLLREKHDRESAERAERQMELAKDMAERADRAKSEFLALMSHELRTPMNGVLGFAQLLKEPVFGPLTKKQGEFVDQVLDSGDHLLRLINDVLDLSKIETGKLTVSIEEVDLAPLLKSVIATLTQSAEKTGIGLYLVEIGSSAPAVRADRVRLAQILINLGSNAIKYNRPNGSVRIACRSVDENTMRIAVEDTGFGIPEEHAAELFEPFNRLGAEHGSIEGSGIGLALSKHLAELMGATIGFRSEPGQGSCFWIDVAVYVDAEGARSAPDSIGPARHRSGYSVLYVEDNPANLLLVRNILSTLDNVTLLEAHNGASGLLMAQQHLPDIILLDVNLPDISGHSLLQRIRRIPELAAVPVLALSANALQRDIQRALSTGFVQYITKPIDVQKFLAAIDAALSASGSARSDIAPAERDGDRAAV